MSPPAKLHPENGMEAVSDGIWIESASIDSGIIIHSDASAPLAWLVVRLGMPAGGGARLRRTATRSIWTMFITRARREDAERLLRAWGRPRLRVRADMSEVKS